MKWKSDKAISLFKFFKDFFDVVYLQSVPLLQDPMDCSQPGSSVHRFSQLRMLEWVAISFSREGLPDLGIKSASHVLAGGFFSTECSLSGYQAPVPQNDTRALVDSVFDFSL